MLQSCLESELPAKPRTTIVVIDSDEESVPEDDSYPNHVTTSSVTMVAVDAPPVHTTVQVITSDDNSTSVVKIEPSYKVGLETMQSSILEMNDSPSVQSREQADTSPLEGDGTSSVTYESETCHLNSLSFIDVDNYKMRNDLSREPSVDTTSSFAIDIHGGCDSLEDGEIQDEDRDSYVVVDSYSDNDSTIGEGDSTSLPQRFGCTFEIVDSVEQQTTSSAKKIDPVNSTVGGMQKYNMWLKEKKRLANIKRRLRRVAARRIKLRNEQANEQAKNSVDTRSRQAADMVKRKLRRQNKNIRKEASLSHSGNSNHGHLQGLRTVSEHEWKPSNNLYLSSPKAPSGNVLDRIGHGDGYDLPRSQHQNEHSIYPLMSGVSQGTVGEQSGKPISLMSIEFPQESDVSVSQMSIDFAQESCTERAMSSLPEQSGVPKSLMSILFEEGTDTNVSCSDIDRRINWFDKNKQVGNLTKVWEIKPFVSGGTGHGEQATFGSASNPGHGDLETINYQIEKNSVSPEAKVNLTTLPFQIEKQPVTVAGLSQSQYQTNEYSVCQIDDQNFTTKQFRAINTTLSPLEPSASDHRQLLEANSGVSQQHQARKGIRSMAPKKFVPKQRRRRNSWRRPVDRSTASFVNSKIRTAALNEAAKRQTLNPKREITEFNCGDQQGQITPRVPTNSLLKTGTHYTSKRQTSNLQDVASTLMRQATSIHAPSLFHSGGHLHAPSQFQTGDNPLAKRLLSPSQFRTSNYPQAASLRTGNPRVTSVQSQFHTSNYPQAASLRTGNPRVTSVQSQFHTSNYPQAASLRTGSPRVTSVQSQFHTSGIQQQPTAIHLTSQQAPCRPPFPTALSSIGHGSVKTSVPLMSTFSKGAGGSPSSSGKNIHPQNRPAQQGKPFSIRQRRNQFRQRDILRVQAHRSHLENVAATNRQQSQFAQTASQLVDQFHHAIQEHSFLPNGQPQRRSIGGNPSRQFSPIGVGHPSQSGDVEPTRLLADIDQGMSTFVAASRQIVQSLNSLKKLVNTNESSNS